MKRILALLAVLMITALPVLAQNNTDYNQNQTTQDQNQQNNDNTMTDNAADNMSTSDQDLPSTASPLPLLSVSAIGTLAAGIWFARRRRG